MPYNVYLSVRTNESPSTEIAKVVIERFNTSFIAETAVETWNKGMPYNVVCLLAEIQSIHYDKQLIAVFIKEEVMV